MNKFIESYDICELLKSDELGLTHYYTEDNNHMRKRWLVFALASVVAMTATGYKKDVEEVVDSIDAQIDTVADRAYEAASAAIEDESPEISEPTTEASKIVRLDDIREETMDNVMLQSKNGVNQLYFMTGMTDVTAEVVSADIIESSE